MATRRHHNTLATLCECPISRCPQSPHPADSCGGGMMLLATRRRCPAQQQPDRREDPSATSTARCRPHCPTAAPNLAASEKNLAAIGTARPEVLELAARRSDTTVRSDLRATAIKRVVDGHLAVETKLDRKRRQTDDCQLYNDNVQVVGPVRLTSERDHLR